MTTTITDPNITNVPEMTETGESGIPEVGAVPIEEQVSNRQSSWMAAKSKIGVIWVHIKSPFAHIKPAVNNIKGKLGRKEVGETTNNEDTTGIEATHLLTEISPVSSLEVHRAGS